MDTKFTQAIREEADARAEYDDNLNTRLGEEIDAREAADTALETKLQKNIDGLEKKHDDFVATKGKANGFASLDGNGLVPSSQLPSYVDDVIEVYATRRYRDWETDRKSTRLNSSHSAKSRMPSSA